MIPPEACDVPLDANKTPSSKTFLATTIMNRNVGTTKYKYGMDHRAIVWCHDLLKVVREMIFALVVTTHQEITPHHRLHVANEIMLGKHVDNQSTFQNDTQRLRDSLLSEVGYAKAVAIQLASPYHLNSLLKLAISALLVNLHLSAPTNRQANTPRKQSRSYSAKLTDTTAILLIVPMLLLTLFCIRSAVTCHGHECQLLLGTVYILSQLAALIYFIVYLVTSLVSCVRSKLRTKADSPQSTAEKNKFSAMVLKYCKNQLQHLLFISPLVIGSVYASNYAFVNDNSDLAWNQTSIAAYCFVSVLVLQLMFLLKSLIILSGWWSQSEYKVTLIFTLAIIKATYGTFLYALSLATGEKTDSDLYNQFFSNTQASIGSLFGYHNELAFCILTKVMPTFIAINAVRAYAAMRLQFNSTCDNNQTTSIKSIAEANRSDGYWILTVVKILLTIWYIWNVFASQSQDDQLIPAYAATIFFTYYWKSIPISSAAVDIYSAVAHNDLSLCCSVAKDQYKKE